MTVKRSARGHEAKLAKLIYWYAFLRLSRSYAAATDMSEGKLSYRAAKQLVPDLDEVLITYGKFGNVWKKNPLDWIEINSYDIQGYLQGSAEPEIVSILTSEKKQKTGKIVKEFTNYLSGQWPMAGHESCLVVSVPLKIKKIYLYEFLKSAIEAHEHLIEQGQADAQPLDKFALTNEKVRMDVLEKAYNIILIEAVHPEYEEWQVAECLGVCLRSVQALKKRAKDKELGINYQDYGEDPNYAMSIHTVLRRYRRYAYVLAENAARGKFPLNDEASRKGGGERIVVNFDSSRLARHSGYISHQLEIKGMANRYASEFLDKEAKINRRAEREEEEIPDVMREAHENFLKNKRTYKPLPPVEE